MKKRLWPFSAIFAMLILVAAACGDDSSNTAASDQTGDDTTDSSAMSDMDDDAMDDAMGDMDDGEHDHGDGIEVPDGMAVPEISVRATPDSVSGANLFVDLANFTVTPENASTDPVDGEGHLHLYIDGERVSRFYNTALHLTGLDEGDHEVTVETSANNHSAYAVDGTPIRASTTISIPAPAEDGGHGHHDGDDLFGSDNPPSIAISVVEDPKSGWNLKADVDDFTFAPENVGGEAVDGEGHLHLYIDGERITRLYGSWWHIPAMEAGDREIMVEVASNDHRTYGADGQPVMAMTTVTVSEEKGTAGARDHDDHAMSDDDDDHGDDHGDDTDGGHSHEGNGEVLDIAAGDADVVISAALSNGDLSIDDRRFSVDVGETVGIMVTSDEPEQIHLHGYDILADIGPDKPVAFAFLADSPGTFEVEFESSGRFLFEIQVR